MLILEGSDCLGKTTFANLLVKMAAEDVRFPIYYAHMTRPNKAFDFFWHYHERITRFAVQDRFHLGGIIWHNAINQCNLNIIEKWIEQVDSMIIVFYASDTNWYVNKLKEDKRENMLTQDTMIEANLDYHKMVNRVHRLKVKVDLGFDIKEIKKEAVYPGKKEARIILNTWYKILGD